MVYSQVCSWLEDYLSGNIPSELYDTWDFIHWLDESEVVSVFEECFLITLKRTQSRKDATNILYTLLWEFYLLLRQKSLSGFKPDENIYLRLKGTESVKQHSIEWYKEKRDILTASEFHCVIDSNKARADLVRSKVEVLMYDTRDLDDQQNVALSNKGALNARAWGHRYESVIKQIYAKFYAKGNVEECGRFRHATLANLAASPDGIVATGERAGRLLEIKAPISRQLEEDMIPEEYYVQTQVQMECCDVEFLDFCEARIVAGESWTLNGTGPCVGAVAVVGERTDSRTWRYMYSPLFDNTSEGRAETMAWIPSDDSPVEMTILEKHVWEIEKIQVLTLRRNPRWWTNVGQPSYDSFWNTVFAARKDPLYLAPGFLDSEVLIAEGDALVPAKPMFLDD